VCVVKLVEKKSKKRKRDEKLEKCLKITLKWVPKIYVSVISKLLSNISFHKSMFARGSPKILKYNGIFKMCL